MLQWMGGSRRKVTASRKSTHNKQKQYFEQRKRQQQALGLENRNDVRNKRVHYLEEQRSLDILSLTNLAKVARGGYSSHTDEIGSQRLDCKLSRLSPAMMLKKLTTQSSNNLEEACSDQRTASLNKLPAVSVPRDAPVAHSFSSKLNDCKMPASSCEFISNNTGSKSKEQHKEVQNEVSVLDLLSDDGPNGNSKGRSVPEAHVAFSVEGLGKVGMETPAHSPWSHKRKFPSPPKASRHMHSSTSLKSISYDLGLDLNAIMHDVSMTMDDSMSEILCNSRGLLNDMGFTKKFMDSYVYPDAIENLTDNFNDVEEIIPTEGRDKQQKSRFDILDDDFLDRRKYDVLQKNTLFCSDGYPSICSNFENSEMHDYGFGDDYFLKKRTVAEAHKRFDISGPSSPYFSYSTSEKEYDFLSFDQGRYPILKEGSDLNSMFYPPAWSFLNNEDSQDTMSLLSEESCSSTAVKEERNYDLSQHQVKLKDCKLSHLDELQMSFDKKYNLDKILEHEMISTSLDRASGERNLAGTKNHKSISNQLSSKAGYYSKKTSSLQGILEPNGISSFKKGYSSANVASVPSCCPKISTEISNASFDCKFMPEEKLFKLFPVPKLNPTADLIDTRSKSKVPANYESSSNFNCDNAGQPSGPDIEFQKSDAHPFGTECYFPYSSSTKNFHIDIQMPDSSGRRNAGKDNEDQNRSFEESKNKISIEKNSVSSLSDRSVVAIDCMDKCNENVESKHEDLLDGPKTRNPFEEAGETVLPIKELPLHLQKSCIADKLYLSYGQSPVPSEVIDKEKLGAERSFGRMGGNKTNTSCQVMLESNFLQLRVQKVLMEAPVKDDRRKVQIQVLEQGNRALENLHLSA